MDTKIIFDFKGFTHAFFVFQGDSTLANFSEKLKEMREEFHDQSPSDKDIHFSFVIEGELYVNGRSIVRMKLKKGTRHPNYKFVEKLEYAGIYATS